MGKTKRIFYYDVLRAMAIIGIVFCHAAGYFVLTGMGKPIFTLQYSLIVSGIFQYLYL